MQQAQIVINGGGMVGASLALALSQAGHEVVLFESRPPQEYQPNQALDLRVSSIHLGSETWLRSLGAWQRLEQMRLCPYRHLQVGEEQHQLHFAARDLNQSHLGHIVENSLLQLALWQGFDANVRVISDQQIKSLWQQPRLTLELSGGGRMQPDLLIAADGANSSVRQLAGIGAHQSQYQQACLVAMIHTPYSQQDITWQQFYPTGPRAFLPLPGAFASLVWYDQQDRIRQLAQLEPEALLPELQQAFPKRAQSLAGASCLARAWFPLQRLHAHRYAKGQVVLVGDAAHAINPLAGQGVNLGFADAQALLELILNPLGHLDTSRLWQYQLRRWPQNQLMMSAMDLCYYGFSNELSPIKLARTQALSLLNGLTPVKNLIARYASG